MPIIRDRGIAENWLTSAVRIASGSASIPRDLGSADSLRVQLDVTAASGITPTLDVVVEDTLDGATWNVIGTFAQKTAAGREVINITSPFSDRVRVRWTIGGTTPSFAFALDAYTQ